jgi:lycopene cyclase domain-containing protein
MAAEYTVTAIAVPIAVIVLEVAVLRTGLLRRGRFWATVALVLAFQVPVDGLLTRGPVPVVSYRDAATSGVRVGWNMPIEDLGFGFALVALTLLLWSWHQRRGRSSDA